MPQLRLLNYSAILLHTNVRPTINNADVHILWWREITHKHQNTFPYTPQSHYFGDAKILHSTTVIYLWYIYMVTSMWTDRNDRGLGYSNIYINARCVVCVVRYKYHEALPKYIFLGSITRWNDGSLRWAEHPHIRELLIYRWRPNSLWLLSSITDKHHSRHPMEYNRFLKWSSAHYSRDFPSHGEYSIYI